MKRIANIEHMSITLCLFSGKDGLIRSATIETNTSVLVRPIDKIVLIKGSELNH